MRHGYAEWSPALKVFWLVVGGSLCLLWTAAIVVRLLPPYNYLNDYAQEWTSARNYFVGQPIYLDMRESIPLHFGRGWRSTLLEVNAHPPVTVLISLPFGKLNYATAYLSWTVLSLATLPVSLWLIVRRRGLNLNLWLLLPIVTLLITSNPLAQQINQGQFNLLLLLLITAAWAAERRGQLVLSGILLGTAAAIKLFPAFLFLYFLMRRQWTAIASGGIAFLAWNGVTAGILGVDCYVAYITDVMPKVAEFCDWWGNASLAGFWSKLFDARSGHVVGLWQNAALAKFLTAVSTLAVVAAAAWKCWRAHTVAERDLAFGICLVAMMLVSPITWDHYFLILLLPLAAMWKYLPATLHYRVALLVLIFVLATVRPSVVWNAAIPGDGELMRGAQHVASVGQPIHSLTVLSYEFYALLAMLGIAYWTTPDERKGCFTP
jgi:hypothetical protein